METLNRTPLTLSELCARIGEALDDALAPSYWVKAEVSSLSRKGGHLYLDLIDSPNAKTNANAKMRATCWSGTQEMLMAYFESETGQPLQAGMAVLVDVEVQWHAVYGLSLSIIGIDPSYTIGDIARLRQQTIAQLRADGLLDAQQLLPLPTLIRRIAVISSPQAAGYEDFIHQLTHSPYAFHLSLFAATMQGDSAAKSILAALEEISNEIHPSFQGGAGGRLIPFDCVVIIRGGGATNDLSWILTGIGHTRDVAILDLVAHEALKTPTAVAEWLIHRMQEQENRITELLTRLQRTAERQILIRRHRIELLEQRLAACNPERIYKMGYSLLTKNGHPVRSVQDLRPGDRITTHLADGSVESIVQGK